MNHREGQHGGRAGRTRHVDAAVPIPRVRADRPTADQPPRDRESRQATVAEFGRRALVEPTTEPLLRDALAALRAALGVDCCVALELAADGRSLRLRRGVGWRRGLAAVAEAEASASLGAEGASVLRSGEPVVVCDRRLDPRFPGPSPLHQQGMVSGVTVAVHGAGGPSGVLASHARVPRDYTPNDVHFQQSIANVLAVALERRRAAAERDALVERIDAAERRADQAGHRYAELLGMMSHELRTPANAILGYVELIERGLRGPLTVAQRADLTRIRRSQEYMLGLMNNVLDYLKLGAGSVRYRLEAVAVEDAMIAAGELIWPILHAGDLHFDRHGDGADVRVHADREKLQQVVLNLLANAAKFTAPGGRVELDWAVDADTVAISVRDTGCGIPADRLESVFDAFVRLDGRGARPASGTGLGLTISRELVAGMGGRLVAESEVGTGSVFTVILPRSA